MSKEKVFDCDVCGLSKKAKNPCMPLFGKGRKGILIVGESPGTTEDKVGRPFVGASGVFLKGCLEELGIDMDRDCYLTNAFHCKPQGVKNKTNLEKWSRCCKQRLDDQIKGVNPKLVFVLGATAAWTILHPPRKDSDIPVSSLRGNSFYSHTYGCWVAVALHPAAIIRLRDSDDSMFSQQLSWFIDDIARGLLYLDKPKRKSVSKEDPVIYTVFELAMGFLQLYTDIDKPVAIDYETNGFYPWTKDAKVLCSSFATDRDTAVVIPFGNFWPGDQLILLKKAMARFLGSTTPKIIQNFYFEDRWSDVYFGSSVNNLLNDTMITSHILDERPKITGLKYQVFLAYGEIYNDGIDVNNLENEKLTDVARYCAFDSKYTYDLHERQQQELKQKAGLESATSFFTEAVKVLSEAHKIGLVIDRDMLKVLKQEAEDELEALQNELNSLTIVKEYVKDRNKIIEKKRKLKKEDSDFNVGSTKQKRELLLDYLKCPQPPKKTPKGEISMDKESVDFILTNTKNDIVKEVCLIFRAMGLISTKLKTYIIGFIKTIRGDGLLHPEYTLNIARSYRSSAIQPNIQNPPHRDERQADFRKTIKPPVGSWLAEIDASGSEVAVIAMLSGDPLLTQQIRNGVDMHTYWAAKLYNVAIADVTKEQRFNSKNGFIFPEFYGSWFKSVANNLKLSESVVEAVEKEFWNKYKGVKAWQNNMIKYYNKHNYIKMPLGFRRYGPLSTNQILNTPIQGTSFHMLLRSCIDIYNTFEKEQLRSKICFEIHDSVGIGLFEEETKCAINIAMKHMTELQWNWQEGVPRRAEVSIGRNWHDMVKV